MAIALAMSSCNSPQEQAAQNAGLAAQAFAAGDYLYARGRLLEAIRLRDDVAEYWSALGQTQIALRDYPAALDAYTRAHELDRANMDALQNLIELSLLLRQEDEAEDYANQLLLLSPSDPRATLAKGMIALQRNRPKEALESAEAVLRIAPQDEAALVLRSRALSAQGDHIRAAEMLELAGRVRGLSQGILGSLLDIYKAAGDGEGQRRTYARLIDAVPGNVQLRIDLARLLFADGQRDEAVSVLSRIPRAAPKDVTVPQQILNLLLELNVPLLTELQVERLGSGASPAMKVALARYALVQNRPSQALRLVAPIAEGNAKAESASAAGILAEARRRLGEPQLAFALANQVLANDPRNPDALLVRGRILLERRDPAAALADAQTVLRDAPKAVSAHLLVAESYAALGKETLARLTFRRAYAAFPADAELADAFKNFLVRTEGPASALRLAQDFARRNPASERAAAVVSSLCARHELRECQDLRLDAGSDPSPAILSKSRVTGILGSDAKRLA